MTNNLFPSHPEQTALVGLAPCAPQLSPGCVFKAGGEAQAVGGQNVFNSPASGFLG